MQPNANSQFQIPAGAHSKQEATALAAVREAYGDGEPVAEIVQPFAKEFARLDGIAVNLKLERDQYINDRLPQ